MSIRTSCILLLFCCGVASAPAQRKIPNVMEPTLPSGTIVLLDPEHPLVKVDVTRAGDVVVIEGSLPRPVGTIGADTSDWNFCRSDGVVCRQFQAELPKTHAVAGRFEFYVRQAGRVDWIRLATKTNSSKWLGAYREFDGFTAMPFFASVNCAVQIHDLTAWEVRNWSQAAIEFRIQIPIKKCPDIAESEDSSD